MNNRVITAIAAKDIRTIFTDSRVWLGIVLLPVLFGILFPALAVGLARVYPITSPDLTNMVDKFAGAMSGEAGSALQSLSTMNQKVIYLFLNYILASIFLLIPILNAMMIASNSFVGEKERRTLETLLFAPIDIKSFFAGKVVASFVPSYGAALVSFILCGVIVDTLAYPMFGYLVFPSWNWIWLMFWVTPMFTVLTILISAFISARVKTFQQAQSIGGMVVLPIVLVTGGQAAGLVLLSPMVLAVTGAVLLVVNALLLFRIAKANQRHVLFESQVH